jgi:hypothetical protein
MNTNHVDGGPMRRFLLFLLLLTVGFSFTNTWAGDRTEFVKISPTVFGPNGLLFTQSADTLAPGQVEMGIGLAYEQSDQPDITLNEWSPTVTVGLLHGLEGAVRAPYLSVNVIGEQEQSLQEVDVSLKWRFLEPNEEYNLPAFGISLSYFLPAGKEALRPFESWGLKGLIVSSAEVELGKPYGVLVGFYADAGAIVSDLGKGSEEKHALIDFGLLFPLTDSRRLQLLLEVNLVRQSDAPLEGDYTATTFGLRYVNPHLNLTGGMQRRARSEIGIDNTNRYVVQGSYLF